jgi:class 3 adenylate cyclase
VPDRRVIIGKPVPEIAPLELPAFLERYPWPEADARIAKPLEWLWVYRLDVEPEAMWPHVIETSRFNRALGLGEMHFEERAGVLHGRSVNGGVRHEWVEEPWSWISNHSLTAVRRYSRGFAHVVRAIYHLVPHPDGGSWFHVYFGWIPRGLIGRLALRVGAPSLGKGYGRVLEQITGEIAGRPAPYLQPASPLVDGAGRRVAELRDQLAARGVDRETIDRLIEYVETGDPMDVYRIQPRRLAREWGLSETAMLSACLHATRVGLLELSWDVLCPHCRGVRAETGTLAEIEPTGACEVCNIEFSTNLENAIEVTFHVHASIREVPKIYYCSAEPSTKLHIKLQQRVAPGDRRQVSCRLAPGRYRLRLRPRQAGGERLVGYLNVTPGGGEKIEWSAEAELGERRVDPDLCLELVNQADDEELFVVEDLRWTDDALRPSVLFSFQEFRDLFAEEYLGADVQLHVGEQTILFTDMVGSTRFYRRLGDPAAFVKVKDHFAAVFQAITDRGGAVVKTIGDAVMGAFPDPLKAVDAACAMNRQFPARPDEPDAIRLRISINTGPCIAVNLNTGIDYFGGTVNVAAKLQAGAEGGQVAMSRRVYEAPGVADFLADRELEEGTYEHPALEPIDYLRFTVE